MAYTFQEEKRQLKIPFTSELVDIICLREYHVFLYFRSGHYQVWNLINNNLIISKTLPNDICQFSLLTDLSIVYLRRCGVIKVHDIYRNTEWEYFSGEVPTSSALGFNTMGVDNDIYTQNVVAASILCTEPSKGLIFYVERVNVSTIRVKHFVTVYNPSISSDALCNAYQDHHTSMQFTYLEKTGKFLLWDQFFLDPVSFQAQKKKGFEYAYMYMGEIEDNKLNISKLEILNNTNMENSLNSIVVGIAETNVASRIIIFENTNIVPIIKVFSIEKRLILKQISFEVDPRGYSITELFGVIQTAPNHSCFLSIMEIEDHDNEISIYKFRKNFKNVMNSQSIKKLPNWKYAIDKTEGKYIVGVEKKYIAENNLFKDMNLNLKFHRAIRSKLITLHLLLKMNVYHIYIIKDVLSFIPE